jgi:hypothetical protein
MALSIAVRLAMSKSSPGDRTEREAHLDVQEAAAYLDRVVNETERTRIEAHLAECDSCRAEVLGLRPIVSAQPPLYRAAPWLAAAAAAVILMVAWPRDAGTPDLIHRESPVTATVSPRALSPSGLTGLPLTLRWSPVPLANSYLARIYDAQGSVLFERETTDTLLVVGRIGLRPGIPYYWKVEARSGFDRSAASPLTEFMLRSSERP